MRQGVPTYLFQDFTRKGRGYLPISNLFEVCLNTYRSKKSNAVGLVLDLTYSAEKYKELIGSKIIFLQLNFIQIVNYRSIPKKIIFFRDSEICTVHEGLPPVIVHARLRPTVVLPALCTQTRPSLKCLRDRVYLHTAGSITLGSRSKSKTDRNNSLRTLSAILTGRCISRLRS